MKLYAPMFSLAASGTIGKAVTFSNWKGRAYARQRVVPANPKSALQVSVRAMMRFLSQAWAGLGDTPQGTWADLATAGNFSRFNAFVRENMQRWREFQPPTQDYPAGEAGTPPTGDLTGATGGPSYIDVAYEITAAGDDWGVILFRSDSDTFTPSRANAIAVLPAAGVDTWTYTDSGLDPGTYYYNCHFFSDDGVLGAAGTEQSAEAT